MGRGHHRAAGIVAGRQEASIVQQRAELTGVTPFSMHYGTCPIASSYLSDTHLTQAKFASKTVKFSRQKAAEQFRLIRARLVLQQGNIWVQRVKSGLVIAQSEAVQEAMRKEKVRAHPL